MNSMYSTTSNNDAFAESGDASLRDRPPITYDYGHMSANPQHFYSPVGPNVASYDTPLTFPNAQYSSISTSPNNTYDPLTLPGSNRDHTSHYYAYQHSDYPVYDVSTASGTSPAHNMYDVANATNDQTYAVASAGSIYGASTGTPRRATVHVRPTPSTGGRGADVDGNGHAPNVITFDIPLDVSEDENTISVPSLPRVQAIAGSGEGGEEGEENDA